MERRAFLGLCGTALGASALAQLLEGCAASSVLRLPQVENQLVLHRSLFARSGEGEAVYRTYVLADHPTLPYPICIYRHSDQDFTALYLECTHRGCELEPQSTYLACPCHGSEFTPRGEVSQPPAEAHLRQFEVTTDDQNIYVRV